MYKRKINWRKMKNVGKWHEVTCKYQMDSWKIIKISIHQKISRGEKFHCAKNYDFYLFSRIDSFVRSWLFLLHNSPNSAFSTFNIIHNVIKISLTRCLWWKFWSKTSIKLVECFWILECLLNVSLQDHKFTQNLINERKLGVMRCMQRND